MRLNIQDIKKVLKTADGYKKIVNNTSVLSILIVGSISEGNFIPGWSDIDLVCLGKNISSRLVEKVSFLENWIEKKVGIKTGIELVDIESLSEATKNSNLAVSYIKYFKNFYKKFDRNKIIFLRRGIKIPVFEKIEFKAEDLFFHTLKTSSYMNNYLKNPNLSKKEIVRKIIKNSLFLMQSYLLVMDGTNEDDYDRVIIKYKRSNRGINLGKLQKFFGMREKWGNLNEKVVSDKDIKSCWNIFQTIKRSNLKSIYK